MRFATEAGAALCSVAVTWGTEMQIKEISFQMEDVDGVQMNGRDSLVILQGVLEGERRWKKKKEEVGLLMHSVNFVTNLDMMLFTAIIDKRRIMFILFLH